MISRSSRSLLLVSLAALASASLSAQPANADADNRNPAAASPSLAALVTRPQESFGELNLPSTPLAMVIAPIEELTGRTVLRQQGLPNPEINLVFRTPPTRGEAMQALESVLNLNQIALVPLGDKFVKLVPMQTVRMESPELIDGSSLALPPSGRVASKLFSLDFLRVNEFIPQIAPLLNANIGNYALFEKANAVLITDSVSNLQRIENLVTKLDRPALGSLQTRFYSLQFAKASDLVNRLRTVLQGGLQAQLSSSTSYTPDDRTNQVILVSDPRQFPFFDDLIQKLDVKADPNTRNEVVYLKHATAKEVYGVLSAVVSGQNRALQTESARALAGGGAATAAAAAAPQGGGGGGAGSQEFSSFVTLKEDERSNSLVISGTVDDIRMLKELIDKLDIILPQVLIEVVIAEVTLSDKDSSGLKALGLSVATDASGRRAVGAFSGEAAGWKVSEGTVDPLAFSAAMTDVGSRSNVKILSQPTIMTMHNKKGTVTVGQKTPIVTGTTSTPISGTTSTNFSVQQQVTYTDIAIELKVTPLIGDDGTIQLEIEQKVDDVFGETEINDNPQPIIGHRLATSFVNVRDGGMVVLGGLQRVKHDRARTKLGLLYEIPVLSQILGGRTKNEERTELLVFVRPKIVPIDQSTATANQKIDQLNNRDNLRQFLEDPSKPLKEPISEKVK